MKCIYFIGLIPFFWACNKPGDCIECALIKNSWSFAPETLRTYTGCWPNINKRETACYDDAALLNSEGNASYTCSCTVTKDDE